MEGIVSDPKVSKVVSVVLNPVPLSVIVLVFGDVSDESEYVLLLESLDPEPAEKKLSSEILVVDVSDLLVALPLPALGGGVTRTSPLSLDPLEIVTGEPSPIGTPTRARPNPRPGLASLARRTAVVNSSSRSVKELVLLMELLRLGAMTRGSP